MNRSQPDIRTLRSNEPRHSIDRFATHRIHGDGAERVVTVKAGSRAFTYTSVPFHGPKIATTFGPPEAHPDGREAMIPMTENDIATIEAAWRG